MALAVNSGCGRALDWLCRAVAIAAAICLWGVGAEAVYFRFYINGCLLLLDAAVVTFIESLFVWQFLLRRTSDACQRRCAPCCLPLAAVDTYRRSILYTLLLVPCFVHYRQLWLPVLPGLLLLLAAVLYASKHCLVEKGPGMVKIPTFVRFDEEASSPELTQQPQLHHQSSFASTSDESAHMGSKDSGIEANRREAAASASTTADEVSTTKGKKSPGGLGGRLGKAASNSPDRCCLLNDDDGVAWRD